MTWEIKDLAGLDAMVGRCLVLAPAFPSVTVWAKIRSLPQGAATYLLCLVISSILAEKGVIDSLFNFTACL